MTLGHPVDYGFEINLFNDKTKNGEMLHLVLKEKQNMEQDYLESSAFFLKENFESKING